MSKYVSGALRQRVLERAANRCEYCLYPQTLSFLTFEVEHIVAEKHGGKTEEENLALACPFCNRFKGTDLGSLDPLTGQLIPFYNPRTQRWADHFTLVVTDQDQTEETGKSLQPEPEKEKGAVSPKGKIRAITPQGRVTERILHFNDPDRIQERSLLIEAGLDPVTGTWAV